MYQEVWDKISEAKSIVLATHVNPDADTLGSALGLYHVIKNEKKVILFNATNLPYNLDFLPGIGKFKKSLPDHFELLITFDAGSFDRIGIEKPQSFIINVDHHRSNTAYGDLNLIEPDFAATSQVVYELLKRNGVPIQKESAVALYTALVDDTGFFRYESVNSDVFMMAAEMCDAGVDPAWIARELTMREPLSKLRLIQKLLETLRLYHFAKIGVVELTQAMLQSTGATKEMADDVLSMVRSLATVEVAILLREEEDGRIKVSLRSKGEVDVGKIAVEFGGGGHRNAAGFTDGTDQQEILDRLLIRLKKELTVEKER